MKMVNKSICTLIVFILATSNLVLSIRRKIILNLVRTSIKETSLSSNVMTMNLGKSFF